MSGYGQMGGGARLAAAGCLLAAACAMGQLVAAPAGGARLDEAIRLERAIKRRYLELIRIMHEVAVQLEKADPETAVAVETAAQMAEEALIADDMDRVVQLLQSGLVLPADTTQARVIERLRQVLKALQGGDELEWALLMTELIREQRERLAFLIGRQRELERHSRAVFQGPAMLAGLEEMLPAVTALEREQKLLLARAMPRSDMSLQVSRARGVLGKLGGRLREVRADLVRPYPSPDQLANSGVTARQLHRAAVETRTALRTVLNRPDMADYVERTGGAARAGELMEHIGAVVSELEVAAKAYDEDNLDAAILAVAECEQRLGEAAEALSALTASDPQVRALKALLEDQERLALALAELRPRIEQAVPADFSMGLPSASLTDYRLGKASIAETKPLDVEEFKAIASAAVRRALREFDVTGARALQEQTLDVLGGLADRLDAAATDIREWHASPRFPIQQQDQQSIVDDLKHVLERYASLTEAAAGDASSLPPLSGELRAGMAAAAGLAQQAAGLLGEEKAEPANKAQREVIRLLTKAVEQMEDLSTHTVGGFQVDFLEYTSALLERMLLKQRMCLEATREVWEKRRPGNGQEPFARAQQLQMRTIAKTQKGMFGDLRKVRLLVRLAVDMEPKTHANRGRVETAFYREDPSRPRDLAGSARVYAGGGRSTYQSLFLALVDMELDRVVKALQAQDPGPDTQQRQERIEEYLETLVAQPEGPHDPSTSAPMSSNDFATGGDAATGESRQEMLHRAMALQEQINARTRELDALARTGRWSEELERTARELRDLQRMVYDTIEKFALSEAVWWRVSGGFAEGIGTSGGF